MARKLILENLMQLAKGIGANTNKYMGTKTNISFLGKGPTKNPLFQNYLPGLETASSRNLGSRDTLIEATEDAMGFATAGKLNDIQLKILTENLSGINKILNPPVLPSAQMFPFPKQGSGIMSVKKTSDPFMGFTPKVVPKTNIPASKINHQMIADKYGIDVELIKGKNWTEVLEIIKNLGYAEGGLADIMQTPRRGRVVHPGGYSGSKRQKFIDLYRSGKGTRQKYIDLSGHGFRKKSLAVPVDPFRELTIQDLMMSGALPSELKDGGLAKILEV
tara:strand:+ start:1594 stop:2421 length:828 start_codon:yes stop_codon:yes gene_type:complete